MKASSNRIKIKGNPVSKIRGNHPLLDLIIPTDFNALGSASVINERGILRNRYRIKNNIKALADLYCKPSKCKTKNSNIVNPTKIMRTITKGKE